MTTKNEERVRIVDPDSKFEGMVGTVIGKKIGLLVKLDKHPDAMTFRRNEVEPVRDERKKKK